MLTRALWLLLISFVVGMSAWLARSGRTYDPDRGVATNGVVTIRSSTRMAGAVASLRWNGKEFLNTFDHGREMQVAWAGNGFGECYNPTEAGNFLDGVASSSKLATFWTAGNVLVTRSFPAFWLPPGQKCLSSPCGIARNQQSLSNYVLEKTVQIGYHGWPNIIEFVSQVTIPEKLSDLMVEAPTGYLNGDFSSFYSVDPSSLAVSSLDGQPSMQHRPVILATRDGSYAMGAWASRGSTPYLYYGHFAFPHRDPANATNKWSVMHHFPKGVAAGVYPFKTLVVVGALPDVIEGIKNLVRLDVDQE